MNVGMVIARVRKAFICQRGIGRAMPVIFAWLTVLLTAGGISAQAENFQVRSWYTENGLPDNTVTSLAQTHDGYLWVGTSSGLARFDGNSFKQIGTAGYANTLEDSNVVALAVDHGGNLWIASESGLITEFSAGEFHVRYRLGEATNSGVSVVYYSAVKNWRSLNSIFAVDQDGNVWATTIAGEVVRFGVTGPPVAIPLTNFPSGRIYGLASDEAGHPWMLKGTHACVWEHGRWNFSRTDTLSYDGKLLATSAAQGFWTAKKDTTNAFADLVQETEEGWKVTPLPIPLDPFNSPVAAMLQDHSERLWLAVPTEGIYVKSASHDWAKVQAKGPLEKCSVRCLFEDRAGSVWVGTWGEGLHQILDPLVHMAPLPSEAANVHVTSVSVGRNGNLWMGTDKGLYRQSPYDSGPTTEVKALHRESVYAVLEDSRARLWVGAKSGIFLRTNADFEKIMTTTNGGILALFEDRKGDLWAGGFRGAILHFHDGTNDFTCQPPARRSLSVCCFAEDNEGGIWVMTRGSGLWRVQDRQLTEAVSAGPLIVNDVSGSAVVCDGQDTLWLGTFGNGLFRWRDGKLQQFTTADGLTDNNIVGMKEDERGNLWMSSRNGIFGCSINQLNDYASQHASPLICLQVGVDEGMADRECKGAGQPVFSNGQDGRCWAATIVGAAGFNPAAVANMGSTPELYVETVNVDGRITSSANVRVAANSRHFEFQYSAPELTNPKKLHFRYCLEGLDQGWTDAGEQRTAVFNRLPPGVYYFRVMVCGENGLWREANRQIRLQVVPFFWQTWWFQTLAGFTVVVSISGGVALHLRRKAQRSFERLEAQRAVEQVRHRITQDLHDELGSAITEIIQIGDLTLQPRPEPEALRSKMEAIMSRVQQLSITVDEIVWTMSSRHDTLRSLVGYLSNHAQEFFRYSSIRCRLDVSTSLPEVMVHSQTRHNLFLATKEALNNAAKHSKATEVILRAHYFKNMLRISIEDNGRGFDPGANHGGEGLINMRHRLQTLGGDVTFSSSPGGGTVITFTLRLGQTAEVPATPV